MSTAPVAVVTGGTGGLGRPLLERFAARGFGLGVTYLRPDEAENLENILLLDEERLLLRRIDATDASQINAMMDETAERFGGINVVVSLVGGWAGGRDVEETDDVRFERMLDVNLRSAFYTARAALPHLKRAEWGRIIFIGSRAARDTPAGQAAFNIAKAGVVALAKSLALELEDTRVTSNVVLPSIIDTPTTREALPFSDYMAWPQPEDIAPVIEFLASEASAVTNGAEIPVYGST
jgi:NAD(P)-dependent dehydrogenase (short-subunit alcohol dehydrogenase family)